ncbi:MAG: twin-arginine translocation signal domain-containing protein [Planctomycetota bacterium]
MWNSSRKRLRPAADRPRPKRRPSRNSPAGRYRKTTTHRRHFLKAAGLGGLTLAMPRSLPANSAASKKPNVILCMSAWQLRIQTF